MSGLRFLPAALLAGCTIMTALPGLAQQRTSLEQPAEYPPAQFEGNQYVDSRGCVFIRAGIGTNVQWVPRMTRSRKLVCGYQPTFAEGKVPLNVDPRGRKGVTVIALDDTPAAEPAPEVAAKAPAPAAAQPSPPPAPLVIASRPAPTPEPKPAAATPAVRTATAPSPAPEPMVIKSQPATPPARAAAKPARTAPSPAYTPSPAPGPLVITSSVPEVPVTSPAQKRPSAAAGYTPSPAPGPLIIASQRTQPLPTVAPSAAQARRVPANTRYVPSPAPEPLVISSTHGSVKPRGGSTATTASGSGPFCKGVTEVSTRYINNGGPLPVRCGPQTESPYSYVETPYQTASKDTRIVPRHVYERRQAQLPKPTVPAGYEPAWSDDRLNDKRAVGTIAGKEAMDLVWTSTVPRRLIDRGTGRDMGKRFPRLFYPFTDEGMQKTYLSSKDRYRVMVSKSGAVRLVDKGSERTVISTRSASVKQPAVAAKAPATQARAVAPAGHRYVQVGTFGVPSNAAATSRRLQSLGLPVATSKITRKGKALQIVLAGPFRSQSDLAQALAKARAAGFGDAFTRN